MGLVGFLPACSENPRVVGSIPTLATIPIKNLVVSEQTVSVEYLACAERIFHGAAGFDFTSSCPGSKLYAED
jgi:hypothetical protein